MVGSALGHSPCPVSVLRDQAAVQRSALVRAAPSAVSGFHQIGGSVEPGSNLETVAPRRMTLLDDSQLRDCVRDLIHYHNKVALTVPEGVRTLRPMVLPNCDAGYTDGRMYHFGRSDPVLCCHVQ